MGTRGPRQPRIFSVKLAKKAVEALKVRSTFLDSSYGLSATPGGGRVTVGLPVKVAGGGVRRPSHVLQAGPAYAPVSAGLVGGRR